MRAVIVDSFLLSGPNLRQRDDNELSWGEWQVGASNQVTLSAVSAFDPLRTLETSVMLPRMSRP